MSEWRADFELLQAFSRQGDQPAFATLTRRHLDLVYATALRKVTDGRGAEEICQNVFGALARKAWQFAPDDSLPSWLHRTTLLESKSWLRGELRRRRREETAAELGTTMNTIESEPAFAALVPLLDEALLSLREKDRTALLLRFYESHSLREVGAAVGVSEDAARMRVQSALEKLTQFFQRRGLRTATVAAATAVLEHTAVTASAAVASAVVSAALQVAPPSLAGFKALLARLASLTKTQKTTLGVALAVALIFWLWRDRQAVGRQPAPQPIATQLAAGNNTTNLQINERIMKTTISTQFSLPLLLSAGLMASNALAQSPGQVVVWGNTNWGQTNLPAAAQSGVVGIAMGWEHMIALKNDGSVVAWGNYSFGQTNVPPAAQSGVIAIAAGPFHNVALKNDGSVVAWGNNEFGQTNVPVAAQSGVVAIAAGDFHSLALKNDGSVVAWGGNGSGQTDVPAAAQSGLVAIAVGDYHSLALKDDGSVVAWGAGINNSGIYPNYGQSLVPVAAQSGVIAVTAGFGQHSLALKNDGSVVAWGKNLHGQTNVPSEAQNGVTAIAAGENYSVALKSDGSVVAWGLNDYGQTDVPAAAQSGVVAVAAGLGHSVALKNDGTVVAWGRDRYGRLNVPPGLTGVTAISAGAWNTMALRGSGWELGAPLALRPGGNQMIVSWPTNATGFTLQSTQTITPPGQWNDVTNPPAVTGGLFTVTNPMSSPSQFFRLRKP